MWHQYNPSDEVTIILSTQVHTQKKTHTQLEGKDSKICACCLGEGSSWIPNLDADASKSLRQNFGCDQLQGLQTIKKHSPQVPTPFKRQALLMILLLISTFQIPLNNIEISTTTKWCPTILPSYTPLRNSRWNSLHWQMLLRLRSRIFQISAGSVVDDRHNGLTILTLPPSPASGQSVNCSPSVREFRISWRNSIMSVQAAKRTTTGCRQG